MPKQRKLVSIMPVRSRSRDYYDSILLVNSLNEDGSPHLKIIYESKIKFFVTKPELVDLSKKPERFVKKEDVIEVECKYSELFDFMAEYVLSLPQTAFPTKESRKTVDFFIKRYEGGATKKELMNTLHRMNCFHGTTVNLVDHYYDRYLGGKDSEFVEPPLRIGFWDIENDIRIYRKFPDPKLAEAPINAITFIYPDIKTGEIILKGYFGRGVEHNAKFEEFLSSEEKVKKFQKTFEDKVYAKIASENYSSEIRKNLLSFKFKTEIKMYENEEDVIFSFIEELHRQKISFLSAFNHGYDIQTVLNRLLTLGFDPSALAHPDVPEIFRNVWYIADENAESAAAKRDSWSIPGYTHFTDYQFLYLAKRKTGDKPSENLEGLLQDEGIPLEKVDYGNQSIADLPYNDFELFMEYSLTDTLAMLLAEKTISDIEDNYNLSIFNRVRFERARSQTTSIEDLYRHMTKNDDTEFSYMVSNNFVRLENKEKEKGTVRGALVCDPTKMKKVGEKFKWFFDKSRNLFRLCCDFDFSMMYPALIILFKIEPLCLKGNIRFNRKINQIDPDSFVSKNSKDAEKILEYLKIYNSAQDVGEDSEPEECILKTCDVSRTYVTMLNRYSSFPNLREIHKRAINAKLN